MNLSWLNRLFRKSQRDSGSKRRRQRATQAHYHRRVLLELLESRTLMAFSPTFYPAPGSPVAVGGSPFSVAVADLNGDGRPDLATANYTASSSGVSVLLGNGAGGFTAAPGSPMAVSGFPHSVAIADLNGDGHPDLVTANGYLSGSAHVLLGNGNGSFTPAADSPLAVGDGPTSVAVADLNGDGRPDLVTSNARSDNVGVLLGNGSGGFSAAAGSPVAVGRTPRAVAIADFNGDGRPDLVTANYRSRFVSVLLGNGAGGFTAAPGVPVSIDNRADSLAVADLNGDGRPDLVAGHRYHSKVSVLLGNGAGGFTAASGSPVFLAFDGRPQSVALADLNDDGRPDLVTANSATGNVSVLLGNGAGGFTNAAGSPLAVGVAPRSVAIADLNGDGRPDLVTANGSGNVSVLLAASVPPTLALGGSTTFIESGPPQLLARGALASDLDNAVLAGGALNVAITTNAASGDRLRVKNQGSGAGQIGVTPDRVIRYEGNIIGGFSGGNSANPLVVTLNANATLPAVQALVRRVTFANADSNPPTELRTVRFLLDDGDGGISLPQFKYVNVQRNSGLPKISMGGEPSYTENAAPLVVSPFAGVEDADSPNFDGGKLTVAIVHNADADDRLTLRNQGTAAGEIGLAGSDVTYGGVSIGTLSGGKGTAPLEISLNLSATRAAVKALVRDVTFATLGDNPSTALRTLSFALDDGDGGINSPVLKSVRVLAVNDAAVITADAGPVGYINNDPAGVLFASTATVTDPDSANFNYGQLNVAVVRGAVAANRLEIRGAFTLSGNSVMLGDKAIGRLTGNGVGFASLTIQFTGQATRSIVEQLARSIRFRSVGAIAAFERTIAVTVLDAPEGFGSTALVKVAVQNS